MSAKGNSTPGPWTVELDGYSLMMGDECVATGLAPDGASADEHRANTRLIAAAPTLYDTLTRISKMTCDHGAGDFCPRSEARAALATVTEA